MINISTLSNRSFRDIGQLYSVLRDLVNLYKNDTKYKLNWRSRPAILFISTLLSSGVIGVIFLIRGIIDYVKVRRAIRNRSRPLLQKQSSTILKNGAREIFIPYRNKLTRVIIPKPNLDRYAADKYLYKNFNETQRLKLQHELLNSKFVNQLMIMWKILIPKVFCQNSYFLATECFFLIVRTWLSLMVAKLDGQIVKDLISGNGKKFMRDLIYWFLIAFPASYTNSIIKYLTRRLSLSFRTNMIRYVHDLYLDKMMIYYKIGFNKQTAIENIDQYITNDITKFCDSLSSLFSNMGKPMMDLVFFAVYLRDNLGTAGIVGIFANYFLTGYILKANTPAFGKLSKERTALEGAYYNNHLNLITNCEEIAFYKGSKIEKSKIQNMFNKLMDHVSEEMRIKLPYSILEDYILKYTWSALGYLFASIPVFMADMGQGQESGKVNEKKNMRQFIINKRLMLSLADAGSRLMYSIKDISELTGYTDRVFTLLTALHQTHAPNFQYGDLFPNDITGTIQNNYPGLRFEKLSVIIPSEHGSEGTTLINDLSFSIKQNQFLLILGANGSGKTSIGRILAGIWPVYRGLLSKPDDDDILFLPQKTYFSNGSLRDQIIYPYCYEDMIERGVTDEDLMKILDEVKLDYLLTREGGNFDVKKDWKDVLSGGEKQRVSIARILFKKPKFVILDESTNAISNDIEDYLFDLLRMKKFTFITFSHRPLLMKYHDYLLEIKTNGEWEFSTIGTDESILSIEKEIKEIEEKLSKVDEWEERKAKIEEYLNGGINELDTKEQAPEFLLGEEDETEDNEEVPHVDEVD